jgi:uncharacterized protein
VRWTGDPDKAAANLRRHRLSFETAALVFDDPLHLSRPDIHPDGDRWQTVGQIGDVAVLVVHTWPEENPDGGEPVGRIISARKATAAERRAYEKDEW